MNLFVHTLNKPKLLSVLVILISFIVFGYWQPLNVVNAEATKTLKACHICDPILPDATATPTPDACALDCFDPALAADQAESLMGVEEAALPENGVLNIKFYWMEGCPTCEDVMKNTLPAVESEFGTAINIQPIELKTLEEINQLFVIGESFGLEKEEIGVPFFIVGEQAISGDDNISERLPILIQSALSPQPDPQQTVPASSETLSKTALRPIFFVIGGGLLGLMILVLFYFRKRT